MQHVATFSANDGWRFEMAGNVSPAEGNFAGYAGMILGTDARWREPYPKPPNGDKRGWVGDLYRLDASGQLVPNAGDLGTRLWTLNFAPLTENSVVLATRAIQEGYQYLIDQQVLRTTGGLVPTVQRDKNRLLISIEFYAPDDSSLLARPFEIFWTYGV